jgi:predicted homoserine dehydrogenase-like protein
MYKMGEGPLYSFYAPYHLCHLEAPFSIARAVLLHDATATPLAGPVVEVVATAKGLLNAGDQLDGVGGYTTYGQCENADVVSREGLLPQALCDGCRLIRPVERDQVLSYDDVEVPAGRLCDALYAEQQETFSRASSFSIAAN